MSVEKFTLSPAVRIERGFPANVRDDCKDEYLGYDKYYTHDAALTNYRGVRVSPNSLIYKSLIVVPQSLYLGRSHAYYQIRHLLKKLLFADKVSLDSQKNYLLATDQESIGHYHWVTEVLPRLWLIRDRSKEFVLLLPDSHYVRSIGMESIGLLGLDFADIVWMREDQFFNVPNLFHISSVALSGQVHDGIMKEIRQAFIGETSTGSRKIYISRSNAWRRRVLNDDEMIKILREREFEIFTGEGMNLKQQIDLFSACETVISIHGAGLANCLFMPPGNVVELKTKEPIHAYWHLASALGHVYYYYNGVPDSDQSLIGTGCNLTIPVEDFEKHILESIY